MLDSELLRSIATQMMSGSSVAVLGQSIPVRRTSSQRLKTVAFMMDGQPYAAIEQNPEKPSQWGQLARAGHQVVQFKDVHSNRFIAPAPSRASRVMGAPPYRLTARSRNTASAASDPDASRNSAGDRQMERQDSAKAQPDQPQGQAAQHVAEAHHLLKSLRDQLDQHPELDEAIEKLEMALSVLAVKTGGML